jgi:hypothetical protein
MRSEGYSSESVNNASVDISVLGSVLLWIGTLMVIVLIVRFACALFAETGHTVDDCKKSHFRNGQATRGSLRPNPHDKRGQISTKSLLDSCETINSTSDESGQDSPSENELNHRKKGKARNRAAKEEETFTSEWYQSRLYNQTENATSEIHSQHVKDRPLRRDEMSQNTEEQDAVTNDVKTPIVTINEDSTSHTSNVPQTNGKGFAKSDAQYKNSHDNSTIGTYPMFSVGSLSQLYSTKKPIMAIQQKNPVFVRPVNAYTELGNTTQRFR